MLEREEAIDNSPRRGGVEGISDGYLEFSGEEEKKKKREGERNKEARNKNLEERTGCSELAP